MSDTIERLNESLAGRYAIERELGQGGMATVYLADDLRHDRKVAVKVLRAELAAVIGGERFVQEIKTTAGLQHPHILPLFDSGEADGFLFYVMPYVEGETLRDRLDRDRQLSIDEAVRIASEMADALDYAHRNAVIHRDIKPENILLQDGRVMVADFGIALAVSAAAGGRMTETGLSLGTPHYMSPEQATAERDLTPRSDVYSLGSVLYEMLTGDPPHTGSSAQQIIMKIVTDEARPVSDLRKSVPAHVAAATAKALEKLPADRFESAAQFAEALADARFMATSRAAGVATPTTAAGGWRVAGWQIAVLMAAGGVIGWWVRPAPTVEPAPVTRFTVPVAGGHAMADFEPNLAISPDGRTLAYFADGVLHKRALDRHEAERFDDVAGDCCLSFSRDGRWILLGGSDGVRRVAVAGGPVVAAPMGFLSDEGFIRGSYDGRGIERATDEGWVTVTTPDAAAGEHTHIWPQLIGGGELVLLTALGPSLMWNDARVVVQDLETGTRTTIAEGATYGRFVPTGHILYVDENGTVEAVPFDLDARRVTGDPRVVEVGVRTGYWAGAASLAVSEGGTLAFVRGSSWGNHILTWVDRDGQVIEHIGRPVTVEPLDLSPDDRQIVTYVASNNADISRFDAVTGDEVRLTFDSTTEDNPVWSPDGLQVAFRKVAGSNENQIQVLDVAGRSDPRTVFSSESVFAPRSWSPDGRWLFVDEFFASGHVLDLEGDSLISFPSGMHGRFSPDGRWTAYTSSETGREEVYVASFPGWQGRQQVSVHGGAWPRWSNDGRELFFQRGDTMMAAPVSIGEGFARQDLPRALFVIPMFAGGYDVSSDERRFIVAVDNPDAPAPEIHVVLNWFSELREAEGN